MYFVYLPRSRFACAVYNDGNICLDILQSQWSPIYDISAILTSIQVSLSLLMLLKLKEVLYEWLFLQLLCPLELQ